MHVLVRLPDIIEENNEHGKRLKDVAARQVRG
jgi:hypothetical protein